MYRIKLSAGCLLSFVGKRWIHERYWMREDASLCVKPFTVWWIIEDEKSPVPRYEGYIVWAC